MQTLVILLIISMNWNKIITENRLNYNRNLHTNGNSLTFDKTENDKGVQLLFVRMKRLDSRPSQSLAGNLFGKYSINNIGFTSQRSIGIK